MESKKLTALGKRIRREMTKWEMPPTQGKTWVIWLKWNNVGWQPVFGVVIYKAGNESAQEILENWAASTYPAMWGENWRKRLVRILPEGKFPEGYKYQ